MSRWPPHKPRLRLVPDLPPPPSVVTYAIALPLPVAEKLGRMCADLGESRNELIAGLINGTTLAIPDRKEEDL